MCSNAVDSAADVPPATCQSSIAHAHSAQLGARSPRSAVRSRPKNLVRVQKTKNTNPVNKKPCEGTKKPQKTKTIILGRLSEECGWSSNLLTVSRFGSPRPKNLVRVHETNTHKNNPVSRKPCKGANKKAQKTNLVASMGGIWRSRRIGAWSLHVLTVSCFGSSRHKNLARVPPKTKNNTVSQTHCQHTKKQKTQCRSICGM